MIRLLKWRRLRWFVVGGVARFVLRRTAARSVDQATADIEAKLPAPVRKALQVVPADAVRAGGSAVVAGRTAKQVAVTTHRVTKATSDRGRRLSDGVNRFRTIGAEIGLEADSKRRELKAEYLRVTEGNGAADDALLDVRAGRRRGSLSGADTSGHPFVEDDPDDDLPKIDPPVRTGRWRAEKRLRAGAVARVQRSYRPLTRPWDR